MELDIFNIDDFIKKNKCPEVTNGIFWNYDTTPTKDGLFSYELFGTSDEERKNIFGYIDLKGRYIHPLVYQLLLKRAGSIGGVITGSKYAVIADKKIKIVSPDSKDAETGIDFLYNHYDEINWIDEIEDAEIDSIDKKTRLKFLKSLDKNEFFVTKWLVLPPFYRAESSTDRSMGDSINKLYKELISRVRGMSLGFSFNIFGEETRLRIQNILRDLYLSSLAPVSGKNLILEKGKTDGTLVGSGKTSMLRKHLLGKNIDWGASSVITSPPNSNANTPDNKPVPFGYSAFPMATLLSLFQPFYVQYCTDILQSYTNNYASDHANDIKKIDINQYNSDAVITLIKRFIKAPNSRFTPIEFKYKTLDGKDAIASAPIYEYKSESDCKNSINYIQRPMTLTDLLYLASKVVLADKHVYVTRFPIANFQNIYPSRIKILSTSKTKHVWIKVMSNEKNAEMLEDDNYPLIPFNKAPGVDNKFYDVMLCGNAYLDTLGGDYDGDMLYMRAVFTQEANREADKIIYSKINMLNSQGEPARGLSKIGKECVVSLYELTKDAVV